MYYGIFYSLHMRFFSLLAETFKLILLHFVSTLEKFMLELIVVSKDTEAMLESILFMETIKSFKSKRNGAHLL